MGYLVAKRDRERAEVFREASLKVLSCEASAAQRAQRPYGLQLPSELKGYRQRCAEQQFGQEYVEARYVVLQHVRRMKALSRACGLGTDMASFPAPMVGGAVIPINALDAILEVQGHSEIRYQVIYDRLDALVCECREREARERTKLLNPFNWVFESVAFVLALPFRVLEAAGWNVEKFEDQLVGNLIKTALLLVVIWWAAHFGFRIQSVSDLVRMFSSR